LRWQLHGSITSVNRQRDLWRTACGRCRTAYGRARLRSAAWIHLELARLQRGRRGTHHVFSPPASWKSAQRSACPTVLCRSV